jgi:hypothetical protein
MNVARPRRPRPISGSLSRPSLLRSIASLREHLSARKIQHSMSAPLRQSIYSQLVGYEDVNDAERVSRVHRGMGQSV